MELTKLSDTVAYLELPPEPRIRNVLDSVNEQVSEKCECDIILDFSFVEVLTSVSISNLITLQNWLKGGGYRLTLCEVAVVTKCIFDVAGLIPVFTFAPDKDAALQSLKKTG